METQIFAYLGVRGLLGKSISIPQTTGVTHPLSGGHAYLSDAQPTERVRKILQDNPVILKGYTNT